MNICQIAQSTLPYNVHLESTPAMKHRLVAKPQTKLELPEPPPLDGLRVVLGPQGDLVAITRNGFEVALELSLAGLNKLHEMLAEQQRKKEIGTIAPIANLCLAEWQRVGPHGAGKIRKQASEASIPDLW